MLHLYSHSWKKWIKLKVYDHSTNNDLFLLNAINAKCLDISSKDCQRWTEVMWYTEGYSQMKKSLMLAYFDILYKKMFIYLFIHSFIQMKSGIVILIVIIVHIYIYIYTHLHLVIYQTLLSKATYEWGQWKQSKSTKEQWYASAITSLS